MRRAEPVVMQKFRCVGWAVACLLQLSGVLAVSGCSSTIVSRHTLLADPVAASPDTIATHVPGADLPGSCAVLGAVFSYRHGDNRMINPSWDRVFEDLDVQAREMGADRIAFLVTGKDDPRTGGGFTKWARGIACDCASGDAAMRRCPTCIVSMPRIRPAEGASDTTLSDGDDRKIRELVQYELSSRGYYLIPTPAECEKSDARLKEPVEEALGSQIDSLVPFAILEVEIIGDSGYNAGIVADKSYALRATLRDAASGDTIWAGEAKGSAGGLGLVSALTSGGAAKQQAIENLFSTLPDLSGGGK